MSAIKLLKEGFDDPIARERFAREARAATIDAAFSDSATGNVVEKRQFADASDLARAGGTYESGGGFAHPLPFAVHSSSW